MKKLLILVVLIFTAFALTGCMSAEDYYNRDQVGVLLAGSAAALAEANARIDELENALALDEAALAAATDAIASLEDDLAAYDTYYNPTDMQRWFFSILDEAMLGSSMQFVSVGDTVTGTVASWDCGYFIIEVDTATSITLRLDDVAPSAWNLNWYISGTFTDVNTAWEDIQTGDLIHIQLDVGFNTFEIDSYYDDDYPFTITILDGYVE